MTMTLISTITVGAGGATDVTFSSIPATYTDLLFLLSCRTSTASVVTNGAFSLNGFSNSMRSLYGTGSTAASFTTTSIPIFMPGSSATANTFGNISIYVPNYTTSTSKSVSIDYTLENNATATELGIVAASASTTSAVTTSVITGPFVQNSTISLYGILKGSGGATVA